LLIQGEADYRCPAEQSEQFYAVLKANGCGVEMLRLPGSRHTESIFGNPAIRRTQNQALLEWMNRYVLGVEPDHQPSYQKPSLTKLKQEFNQLKGERFPWVYEVSKTACEGAFMDLRAAFKNYFERQKAGTLPKAKPGRKPRKDGQPLGYPHFKSKKKATLSFY
jgi:hypothetical protein